MECGWSRPHSFFHTLSPTEQTELQNPKPLAVSRSRSQSLKYPSMEDFDLENPLTNARSQQQDSKDTISALFDTESDHMPLKSQLRSSEIQCSDGSFRQEAISVIAKARFSCDFDAFLSYLAVNYLDRFVSTQAFPKGKPWIVKLVSISCLSLAAKMKKSAFSLSNFQSEEGIIFDSQTIRRMELLILGALKWRMRSITPFAFLPFFLSFFKRNDLPLKQALKSRATEIIFNSQHEINIFDYKPSIVAASALLSASHELFPVQFPCFHNAISSCSYVNKEELLDCYNVMQEVVLDGYGPILCDTISRSDTPVNVLDRRCLSSESETTSGSENPIFRSEAEIKRQKISDFYYYNHLSQQPQRC